MTRRDDFGSSCAMQTPTLVTGLVSKCRSDEVVWPSFQTVLPERLRVGIAPGCLDRPRVAFGRRRSGLCGTWPDASLLPQTIV